MQMPPTGEKYENYSGKDKYYGHKQIRWTTMRIYKEEKGNG